MKQPLVALIAIGLIELASQTSVAAFSIGFGVPIEERMGSEYGAEYYYRNARGPDAASSRPSKRCRTKTIKGENGVRRVRRCR